MQKILVMAMALVLAACGGGSGSGDHKEPETATLNVTAYGAVGDGWTDNTLAIQRALDEAGKRGATVEIPEGTFITGALFLHSNTTLRIAKGATLKAINAETYWNIETPAGTLPAATAGLAANIDGNRLYPQVMTRVQGIDMNWVAAIINIRDVRNVRITGQGVIDGNGSYWWRRSAIVKDSPHSRLHVGWAGPYDDQRPRSIESYKSSNVAIDSVTIRNSPFWTVHLVYSDGVHVSNILIDNLLTYGDAWKPSTDGIDIDSSRNVLVEDSTIAANDDAIALKSGRDGNGLKANVPTEHILIRNVTVKAGAAGLTLGSETSGGVHDVEVDHMHIKPVRALVNSNLGYKKDGPAVVAAFFLKSSELRGGLMSDINIHDVDVDDAYYFLLTKISGSTTKDPLTDPPIPAAFAAQYVVPPYWSAVAELPEPLAAGVPHFKGLSFRNIRMNHVVKAAFAVKEMVRRQVVGDTYSDFVFENVRIDAATAAGSINSAKNWHFTNSSVRDATGKDIAPVLDRASMSGITGLAGLTGMS